MGTRPIAEKEKLSSPRRGELYLVAFDPTAGFEIQKTRPAVVIQNDVSNRYSPVTIVAAISSQFSDPPFPREVIVETAESGLPKRSAVILNQIRFVDRRRLGKKLGRLSVASVKRVEEALKISLGLIDI